MHLWCTASQQVDKSRIEGHDSIAHVHHLLLIITTISRPESREGAELVEEDISERRNRSLGLKLQMSHSLLTHQRRRRAQSPAGPELVSQRS